MAISRKLPESNISRNQALSRAKQKNDDTPALNRFLTTPTQTRLNAIAPNYKTKMLAVDIRQAAALNSTALKNEAVDNLRTFTSHFLQVLNFMIVEEKAQPGDRAYYGMSASNEALPPLGSEPDVLDAADKVISGEAARTALPGAIAVPLPTVAEVTLKQTAFQTSNTAQSTAVDALDIAQEAVAAQNEEADHVIKKVWDEVETFFNEEPIESKRANAREWGVVYVSTEAFDITGRLNVQATGLPPATATITLEETGANGDYDSGTGIFIITTGLTGPGTLKITSPGLLDKEVAVDLPGDADVNVGQIDLT